MELLQACRAFFIKRRKIANVIFLIGAAEYFPALKGHAQNVISPHRQPRYSGICFDFSRSIREAERIYRGGYLPVSPFCK